MGMKNESTPCAKAHLQSAFFNLRVLIGLFIALAGVFLAMLGFGVFSPASTAQAQQKYQPAQFGKSVDPLVPAMGAMFIVGASDTASVVIRQSLLLLHTPDRMRGRVFAVGSMFTGTLNQLGDFRAGAAAALFGTIPAVLIGGCSTIAVVLVSTRLFRELYQADRYEPAKS